VKWTTQSRRRGDLIVRLCREFEDVGIVRALDDAGIKRSRHSRRRADRAAEIIGRYPSPPTTPRISFAIVARYLKIERTVRSRPKNQLRHFRQSRRQ